MRVLWTTNEDPAAANSLVYIESSMMGLREHGIEVTLECIGPLRTPMAIRRASSRIRRIAGNFDLVHAQYGSACGLTTSLMPGIAKVLTIRGSDWATRFCGGIGWQMHDLAAKGMTAACLHRYDHVVTVSFRLADSIATVRRRLPITVLPSAIDLDRFRIMDRQEARRAIGEGSDGRPWVLFTSLSQTNPIKRLSLAQRAVEIAAGDGLPLRLKVLSDVAHAQVPLHVAACDVILCTSVTEGWPNSVKEALACGLPFVSTDVSDLRQIAAIAPPSVVCQDDPRSLAVALKRVLASPRTRGERIGMRASVQGMGTKESARIIAAIYRAAVARAGSVGRPAPDREISGSVHPKVGNGTTGA